MNFFPIGGFGQNPMQGSGKGSGQGSGISCISNQDQVNKAYDQKLVQAVFRQTSTNSTTSTTITTITTRTTAVTTSNTLSPNTLPPIALAPTTWAIVKFLTSWPAFCLPTITSKKGSAEKMKKSAKKADDFCRQCGTKESTEWRKGPLGRRTLCNAHGLLYASRIKKQNAMGLERIKIDNLIQKRRSRSRN